MTKTQELHWKFNEQDFNAKGLSLDIIDYEEILDFVDIEVDDGFDIMIDPAFRDKIAKSIYNSVKYKNEKGSLHFQVAYQLV